MQFKLPTDAKSQLIVGGAVLLVGGGLLYALYRFIKSPFSTKGTPYESAGNAGGLVTVAAGLGAATNRLLGGAPEAVGSAIGGTLYDWFGDNFTLTVDIPFTFVAEPSVRGAQPADKISEDGSFTYNPVNSQLPGYKYRGKKFRMKRDKDGKAFATGPL
jgi:hypothetical protein